MYGDRRYTPPSSRQSYGRQDLRRNPIQTSSSSSQRKHSSQSRGRPNSGQFLKPVEPVRKEPVHSSKERATAKKEAEKKGRYTGHPCQNFPLICPPQTGIFVVQEKILPMRFLRKINWFYCFHPHFLTQSSKKSSHRP